MLQVTLSSGTNRQQVICLVDSGADDCLFHSSIGRRLGIDVETGEYKKFDGIADSIDAYMHTIEIQIQDFPDVVTVEVGFTEADGVDAIF
jgi:predicted aspartyl protease